MAWETIPGLLRRKGYHRKDLQSSTGGFQRKSPVDEVSVACAQRLYEAAKDGFPLHNGGRQHCFPWEPKLWREWGVAYSEFSGDERPVS